MIEERNTTSRKELFELRKKAQARAAKCLPFSQYDEMFRHLVYYYELQNGDVRVYMNPMAVDDKMFHTFVDEFNPVLVGAFHRH